MKRTALLALLACLAVTGCTTPGGKEVAENFQISKDFSKDKAIFVFSSQDVRPKPTALFGAQIDHNKIYPITSLRIGFAKVENGRFGHYAQLPQIKRDACEAKNRELKSLSDACDYSSRKFHVLQFEPGGYAVDYFAFWEQAGIFVHRFIDYQMARSGSVFHPNAGAVRQQNLSRTKISDQYYFGGPNRAVGKTSPFISLKAGDVVYAGDLLTRSMDKRQFRPEIRDDFEGAKAYLRNRYGEDFASRLSKRLFQYYGDARE